MCNSFEPQHRSLSAHCPYQVRICLVADLLRPGLAIPGCCPNSSMVGATIARPASFPGL